jgi:hypothetical protein
MTRRGPRCRDCITEERGVGRGEGCVRRLIEACTSYGVFVWRRGDEARGTIGALYSRTVLELDKARLDASR